MNLIQVLPDRVANQIAAGEVVERPASIVKELIENSIDAGATRVEVEFRHGGRSHIRVEDNGRGMSRDDALMSLERHATSKIRKARDLETVLSFGFRGEALPSIASVSKFSLQTRDADSNTGTEILVNGGKVQHVRDCGMPVGTRIVVSNLFNSVPARRKFLKSDATEAAHIIHQTRLHALACPDVSFALYEDGRANFSSPVCSSLVERIGEVYGKRMAADLIEASAGESDLKLSGLISRPGVARSTRHEMITFVNRRPVESRTLAYALLESYHTHIPKGRYPMAFLFLEIDPARIDVNVHPAKREIRFREEAKVRGFTVRTVLNTLRAWQKEALPKSVSAVPGKPITTHPVPDSSTAKPKPNAALSPTPGSAKVEARASMSPVPSAARPATRPEPVAPPAPTEVGWRSLGRIQRGYHVFETANGLVLLDIRAAVERIWFERLMTQTKRGAVESQQLLLPIPLELDPVASSAVAEHRDFLQSHGFKLAPFGRNFFRIEAVPAWLSPEDAETFFGDVLALIRTGRGGGRKSALPHEEMARVSSSRAAAIATTDMTPAAMVHLVGELLRCETPHSNPQGRPTFVEISTAELARRFHKTGSEPEMGID